MTLKANSEFPWQYENSEHCHLRVARGHKEPSVEVGIWVPLQLAMIGHLIYLSNVLWVPWPHMSVHHINTWSLEALELQMIVNRYVDAGN